VASPVLVFVPLDGRPVTMDIGADRGRAAGVDVRTPDRVMLSDRFRLGEVDRVWEWLEREVAGGSAALVASVETLCFGGLVASRKSEVGFEEIAPRLHRLYEIASRLPTYVSAVIPRTPQRPTDEDAAYWKTGDQAAMLRHRNRHLKVNADLISAASRGVLHALLIGQDDTTPGSPSQADRATLQRHAAASSASNALLTSGTDELNARLFARFPNDADRALIARLLAEPRFGGIVAYAGWNTCSNSLGSVMASATVVHHLRAGTVPGNDRIYRPAFFTRILDDWGYQSIVRPHLTRWLEERGGSPSDLGERKATLETMALEKLRGEALPPLQRSFVYHPVKLQRAAFPWLRLFEIGLEVDIANAGRGRGIVVVEYDPSWPQIFEKDKAAILRALGPLVRGIEHVGSTAVTGLAAKPIVDVLLGVDADDLDSIIEPLVAIGYTYNPDWEISTPMRRYFRRLTPDGAHTHHLHAVPYRGEFWTQIGRAH